MRPVPERPTPRLVNRVAGRVRRFLKDRRRRRRRITHVDVVVSALTPGRRYDGLAASSLTLRSIERAHDFCLDRGVDVTVGVRFDHEPSPSTVKAAGTLRVHVANGSELAEHALARYVETFGDDGDLDLVYSDAAGRPDGASPRVQPGFSPERLVEQMYLGHVVAVRASVEVDVATAGVGLIGWIRPSHPAGPGATAAGDMETWTWLHAVALSAQRVIHLPERLYVAAAVEPHAPLSDGISPAGRPTVAPSPTSVSIIIPTRGADRRLHRGQVVLVEQAIRSVVDRSTHPEYELIVVTTPGTPDALGERLSAIARSGGRQLTIVHDDRLFNFSNACNLGAVTARGRVLVFLNDDTEVIGHDWIQRLCHHAMGPEIGAVGAKLLFEDQAVQHAGIWCRGGHPVHRYEGADDDGGYLGALDVAQNCLAVTGACLAVDRAKFVAVGGFSPEFPNSYNDVDLCLKLLDQGWRTVIEPRARLYHFEASTRDPTIDLDDMERLHSRWRHRLNHDPFDNPTHRAKLSEELPLPEEAYRLSDAGNGGPAPRRWPLDPVVATPQDLRSLIPHRNHRRLGRFIRRD
jgi:GT2 family glycosyltransferase